YRTLQSFPTRRSSDLGIDGEAGLALAAGVGAGALLAVQALGEDAGDGGLAHAAGAGEEVGVVDAARLERIAQGPDHVFLAHQFGEPPGAPLAVEDEVGHAAIVQCRGSDCPGPRHVTPFARRASRRGVRVVEGARLESV